MSAPHLLNYNSFNFIANAVSTVTQDKVKYIHWILWNCIERATLPMAWYRIIVLIEYVMHMRYDIWIKYKLYAFNLSILDLIYVESYIYYNTFTNLGYSLKFGYCGYSIICCLQLNNQRWVNTLFAFGYLRRLEKNWKNWNECISISHMRNVFLPYSLTRSIYILTIAPHSFRCQRTCRIVTLNRRLIGQI